MPSILRQLQAEWNDLVPRAQARGIRRVRLLGGGDVSRGPLESIAYRRQKLDWLKAILNTSTSLSGLGSLSFGVELECILPQGYSRGSASDEISAAGVPCHAESLNHHTPRGHWKCVPDGSLGLTGRGCEFVSPPLTGDSGFRQIDTVCDVLTRISARISVKCGLHVHVGVADAAGEFFKNIVVLYGSAQEVIDTFMPASRRGSANAFCRPVRQVHPARMAEALSVEQVTRLIGQTPAMGRSQTRYCKLNLESFFAYGTVEFRHHGGTVDKTKVKNWVRFCLKMVLAAKAGEKVVSTMDDLFDAIDADSDEREYFRGRVRFFTEGDTRANRFGQYASQTAGNRGHVEHQPLAVGTINRTFPSTSTGPWTGGVVRTDESNS